MIFLPPRKQPLIEPVYIELGDPTYHRVNVIKLKCMRDNMGMRVTPPKRLTSRTWVSPPPCKQLLRREGVRRAGLLRKISEIPPKDTRNPLKGGGPDLVYPLVGYQAVPKKQLSNK